MKKKREYLYHFNPGHDMALANGEATFIPPLAIQQMQRDLSLLPIWHAANNGTVLSEDPFAIDFITKLRSIFPAFNQRHIKVVSPTKLPEILQSSDAVWDIEPWGWDWAERAYLRRCGVPDSFILSNEQIEDIIHLSNRRTAVDILPHLQINDHYIGESHYYNTISACLQFTRSHATCVFKAPLSGSGKGLNWYRDGKYSSPFERWCHRQLSLQGGVVCEPIYDKIYDMAIEIQIDYSGKAYFLGYSFFNTTSTGVYRYNLLVPDNYCSETLYMKHIHSELLPHLLTEIEKMYGGHYIGCIGIDIMICPDKAGQPTLIHPCVEINTRLTMGILAHNLYNQYISRQHQGEFHIDYHHKEGEALVFDQKMQQKHPLETEGAYISKGYLSLTPIYRHTHSQAWIIIK